MNASATTPSYRQLPGSSPARGMAASNATSYYNWSRHPDMDIIEGATVQALFFICYTTIFVLGVFGNVLVCYVVGRNRAMQTVTNFFITNLALSDILLCILAVPFTPLYSFLGQWIFGRALCHLVAYAQGTSVYISTLTLTSIAIDRFFVIIYPFHPRMQLTTCVVIITSIWLFSVLVTLPYGLYMNHKDVNGRFYCEETWPSESFRQIYGVLTAVLQFLVPFVIIAFCYVRVSLKLRDRARLKPGCKSSRKEEADRERKRRTNRMLIAMVTIFGISWMPLNVINLLNDVYIPTGNWRYYYFSFFVVHALAMSSTCYNPFLYAWLNDNFRKEFKQALFSAMSVNIPQSSGSAIASPSPRLHVMERKNKVLPCFDPSGNPTCGAGYHHHHHHHHVGGAGLGCMEGGRGGLGGDLALPCPGRRSISSAVRTMTTTDDWINNKSASHSPPTPTGPTGAPAQLLDGGQSRDDSSPELDRYPLASLRGRKADSVEMESVHIMETAVTAGRRGAPARPEGDPGSESPTSAAQEAAYCRPPCEAAQEADQAEAGQAGQAGQAAQDAQDAQDSRHQLGGKRHAKSRFFGSASARAAAAPTHRTSAKLLAPSDTS